MTVAGISNRPATADAIFELRTTSDARQPPGTDWFRDLPGVQRLTLRFDPADRSQEEEQLTAIREMLQSCGAPLLLFTGLQNLQLAGLKRLQARRCNPRVRQVLCIADADRPLLLPPVRFRWPIDAVVIHSRPVEAERRNWSRRLPSGLSGRVFHVSPQTRFEPGADGAAARLRETVMTDGETLLLTLAASRTDAWLGIGMQAFAIWSRGEYDRCHDCGGCNIDPATHRHEPRRPTESCRYCGGRLIRGASQDNARLLVSVPADADAIPDPKVLADWLGIAARTRVVGSEALGDCLQAADAALLLGDPAFANPLFEAACALCPRVISNDRRASAHARGLWIEGSETSWDHREHRVDYPSLATLVDTFEKIGCAERPRPGSRIPEPGTVLSLTTAALLQTLASLPRQRIGIRRRLRR